MFSPIFFPFSISLLRFAHHLLPFLSPLRYLFPVAAKRPTQIQMEELGGAVSPGRGTRRSLGCKHITGVFVG